jgi:hypothetical protein
LKQCDLKIQKGGKYMKKLWIAFAIAMVAVMMVASPALAWGNVNANVDCSDVNVTDDSPPVGTTITFSGTVTITSNANICCYKPMSGSYSNAWYEIYDPDGVLVYSDNQEITDVDWANGCAYVETDAGQVYCWSQDVYIELVGDYLALQGGFAGTSSGYWVSSPCPPYYRYYPIYSDTDSCSANRTVTSHAGAGLGMVASPARLVIQLPAGLAVEKPLHSKSFFSSDGWGDPTSDTIVYNDGIWQVEIADGTIVQLDGEWHKYTWIEVDDQGNVTGKYGSDGHIIAEEIGLSQPITVTKVG